jgi:hypothetical protein
MVTIDDVQRMIDGLDDITEGTRFGNRTWLVGGKAFAWLRPFSKADVRRFAGAPVPDGTILAVRTADLDAKEAVLAEGRPGFFTIPHFGGFAAVLIQLDAADGDDVDEALADAWHAMTPTRTRRRPD